MLYLQRPQTERIRGWLQEQSGLELTYPETGGSSAVSMPPCYHHIDWSVSLGRGESIFALATEALQQWASFNLDWACLVTDGPLANRCTVAVAARVGGLWSVNFCRIIEFDPGQSDALSWHFTVGTLPRHMASGEERISVSLDPDSQQVTYRIRSFSRPRSWLVRLAKPVVRQQQARFCRDSGNAMSRFIRARDRVAIHKPVSAVTSLSK